MEIQDFRSSLAKSTKADDRDSKPSKFFGYPAVIPLALEDEMGDQKEYEEDPDTRMDDHNDRPYSD
jgi:hypothetical protein